MRAPRPASVVVAVAAAAGAFLLVRRRRAREEYVGLYYADGTSVSLEDGAPEGDRMLELARDALRLARER